MTAANKQIIAAFEDCGLGPGEIADSLGWEISAVKSILSVHSRKYRQMIKDSEGETGEGNPGPLNEESQSSNTDITQEEYEEFLQAYKSLALNAEVESVRERALRNLINERKGRNDILAPSKVGNLNINQINILIKQARGEMKELLGRASPINIEAQVKSRLALVEDIQGA